MCNSYKCSAYIKYKTVTVDNANEYKQYIIVSLVCTVLFDVFILFA